MTDSRNDVDRLRKKLDKLEEGLPSGVVEKIERRHFSDDEAEDIEKKIDRAKGAWWSMGIVALLIVFFAIDLAAIIVKSLLSMSMLSAVASVVAIPVVMIVAYLIYNMICDENKFND
jgi:Flp pilus assembly protein TadB